MSANLEGRNLFLDLLPPDDFLRRGYAFLPPLTVKTKWHEQYTEQGPKGGDFDRVFRFYYTSWPLADSTPEHGS
jgi:hypothetical protein